VPERERVTVVIATHNRRDELCRTLRMMSASETPLPIVVVDNLSTDGTASAVRGDFPAVTVVTLPSNEGAAARNVGARLANTPYVAFCDDDSWYEPGALDLAADRLDAHPSIGLLAATVLVGPEATVDPTSTEMAGGILDGDWRRDGRGPRAVTGFLACAAVIRRRAFLAAGGFEPHLKIGGEEELISLDLARAGWKLLYLPEAVVHHMPSTLRDSPGRQRLLTRNALLIAALRYSEPAIARRLGAAWREGRAGRPALGGIADALSSSPWVWSRRSPVSCRVETAFLDPGRLGRQDT
jgi:GT2 family glycosyltransferase